MSSYKVELKEYLITVQHLLCLAIKDNLILNNRFKTFSNNLIDKDETFCVQILLLLAFQEASYAYLPLPSLNHVQA